MVIKHKLPDTREEWLQGRTRGIGGSDAGAIMGVNKYKSPYTVWAEKCGRINGDVPDNEAMRIGRDLEDYVAKRFTEQTGLKVRRSGYSYQSKERPYMLANVDRFVVGEKAGLECKTASVYAWEDYKNGKIPLSYYCQCLHYMAVMGFERMYLAAIVLGKGFYTFTIDAKDESVKADMESLIDTEERFWKLVESETEPVIDGSDSTKQTLCALNPADAQADAVDLQSLEAQMDERDEYKQQIESLTKKVDVIDNRIRKELGTSETGFTERYKVTFKEGKRSRTLRIMKKKERTV